MAMDAFAASAADMRGDSGKTLQKNPGL